MTNSTPSSLILPSSRTMRSSVSKVCFRQTKMFMHYPPSQTEPPSAEGHPCPFRRGTGDGWVPPGPSGCTCSRRSEEHTSELQSRENLVCRLLREKKNTATSAT